MSFEAPRDSKPASELIAEVHHSHQIPIGSGGVVFRWRRRSDGFRMTLYRHFFGHSTMYLDGVEPPDTLLMFSFSPHVLCFTLEEVKPTGTAFVFAAEEADVALPHDWMFLEDFVPPPTYRILSKPDGRWKFTRTRPPNDDWMKPGFDDSLWDALSTAPHVETQSLSRPYRWQAEHALELGARYLVAPAESRRVHPATDPHTIPDGPSGESSKAGASQFERLWVRHEFVTGPELELKLA